MVDSDLPVISSTRYCTTQPMSGSTKFPLETHKISTCWSIPGFLNSSTSSHLGYSLRSDFEPFLRLGHEIGLDTSTVRLKASKFQMKKRGTTENHAFYV
jgi:hypothetical protein